MTRLIFSVAAVDLQTVLPRGGTVTDLLGTATTSMWWKDGYGMLGWGRTARFTATGAQRFSDAQTWWEHACQPVDQPDHLDADLAGLPVRAPVAFASYTFDARSAAASVVEVPEVVLVHRPEGTWVVWHGDAATSTGQPRPADALRAFRRFALDHSAENSAEAEDTTRTDTDDADQIPEAMMSEQGYLNAVAGGLESIAAGRMEKVVLARDVVVHHPAGLPLPATLKHLTHAYRHCWTYLVDGLLGSTPELLIDRHGDTARARVLAGTTDRATVPAGVSEEDHVHAKLVGDAKQQAEHRMAVESLTERLAPYTDKMDADPHPFVLQLPNVWHLATDVTAALKADTSVVELASAVHPTAAVGGTPREQAADEIYRLECETAGLDRGRYAGPVGWFDASGAGEFGIALRGGLMEDPYTVRLYAGCGVVAGSVPEDELAETTAKMRPMRDALNASTPLIAHRD